MIASAMLIVGILFAAKLREERIAEQARLESQAIMGQQQLENEEVAVGKAESENLSVYQKLSQGQDVNILIVGDSIGQGDGCSDPQFSFPYVLANQLKNTYGSNIKLGNISMGGTTSYTGYMRTMALEDQIMYDLAIVCYGQNDGTEGLSLYYETIIRAIQQKYPQCSIISILEHPQREYTEKMKTIQEIAAYYSIPVADTIAPFRENYDSLVVDGVHPNDAGYQIYANTLMEVINQQVRQDAGLPNYGITPINAGVSEYQNFRYLDKSEFIRVGNTYSMNVSISGIMGIRYMLFSGENVAKIYTDGTLHTECTFDFAYDFNMPTVSILSMNCNVENNIEIEFANAEQADGFAGLAFRWK